MITGKEGLQEAMIAAFSMEKGTREFYSYAVAKSITDEARETFIKLRDWEDSHMHYIESLYQELMGDREFHSYEEFRKRVLTNDVESGIPLREAEKLFEMKRPTDDMEIIVFALEMEGKAYNLYRRFSEDAEDADARVIFQEMKVQEQKHIDALMSLKRSI